jgi:hypothetical protein
MDITYVELDVKGDGVRGIRRARAWWLGTAAFCYKVGPCGYVLHRALIGRGHIYNTGLADRMYWLAARAIA